MVWPFKKSKEMIDMSYLVKRGLMKLPKQEEEYKNLNPMAAPSTGNGDALSFLSGLASTSEASEKPVNNNKVEDIEFRLDNLIKRIDQMFDRLDLVEKKLARNERQS
jgi:hypothetical protein